MFNSLSIIRLIMTKTIKAEPKLNEKYITQYL